MKGMKHIIKTILFILCIGAVSTTANAESECETIINPTEIHVGYDGEGEYTEEKWRNFSWKKEYSFTDPSMEGKMIPIYVCEDGILRLDAPTTCLYDKNKNKIERTYWGYERDGDFFPNVKKGDLLYYKIDTEYSSRMNVCIIPEQGKHVLEEDLHYIIGTGKMVNKYFSIKKKSVVGLVIIPTIEKEAEEGDVIVSLQKKQNGKWNTIIRNAKSEAYVEGKWEFNLPLTKGQYRLKMKIPKKQFVELGYYTTPARKVAYKQKKAIVINKKIKISRERGYAFFLNDTKAHYFKFKATSKRKYLTVLTDVNTGKLKITVYQKGSAKPITTLVKKRIFKDKEDIEKDIFRGYIEEYIDVSKCKGTVYVKVEKVNKKSSGAYKLILSKEKGY